MRMLLTLSLDRYAGSVKKMRVKRTQGKNARMMSSMEFTEHAKRADLAGEKAGAVCSFCGAVLPGDYYLLLSAWRSGAKELVGPQMRFCDKCWNKIQDTVSRKRRQVKMPL